MRLMNSAVIIVLVRAMAWTVLLAALCIGVVTLIVGICS